MFTPPLPYKFSKLISGSVTAGNPTGRSATNLNDNGSTRHYISLVPKNETITLADIEGPGMVRHIWLTFPVRTPANLRGYIIRMYWDDCEYPSVEAPLGDFFGLLFGRTAHYSTPYMGVSEGKGFNCFFPMPFSKHCRITLENDSLEDLKSFFYQISFTFGDEITSEMGRFHAHFRRSNPPKGKNHLLLETSGTPGVYVGCAIGAIPLEPYSWREGDFRFFIDGKKDYPNIVGTGWSDWFLSGWGLGLHQSMYAGSTYQLLHPEFGDKYFCSCFRFHVLDPIYFQHDLRIEHSQIGYFKGTLPERSDDWSSVVYWYQNLTETPLPPIPSREERVAGIAIQDWELEALARMKSGLDRKDDK